MSDPKRDTAADTPAPDVTPATGSAGPTRGETDDDGWGEAARSVGIQPDRGPTATDDDGWDRAARGAPPDDSDGARQTRTAAGEVASDALDDDAGWDVPAPTAQPAHGSASRSAIPLAATTTTRATDAATAATQRSTAPSASAPRYTPPRDATPYTSTPRASDLQAAAGVTPRASQPRPSGSSGRGGSDRDSRSGGGDGDGDGTGRSRRALVLAATAGLIAVVIALIIIWGQINSDQFYYVCSRDKIAAERGRAFPPWGRSRLSGPTWAPIQIPDDLGQRPRDLTCETHEVDDRDALIDEFRRALLYWAEHYIVTGTEVDVAETYLTQAEELSRGDSDTDTDLRTRIQRLRADVQYWRARRKVEAASAQLREAVTRFREARDGLPRHNSDADAWAEFVESLTRELGLGPAESRWRLRLPPAAPAASGRPARSPPPDAGVPGTPDAEPGMALPPTRDAAPTEPEPGAIPESPPPPKVPEGGTLS